MKDEEEGKVYNEDYNEDDNEDEDEEDNQRVMDRAYWVIGIGAVCGVIVLLAVGVLVVLIACRKKRYNVIVCDTKYFTR